MDPAAVMQEVADRLAGIGDLQVFPEPPAGPVMPPGAVVHYPDAITFDVAYGEATNGTDTITLVVSIVVGSVVQRATRVELGAYCRRSGERSVKAMLESGSYETFDNITVSGVEVADYTEAGIQYLVAEFSLEIMGRGAV